MPTEYYLCSAVPESPPSVHTTASCVSWVDGQPGVLGEHPDGHAGGRDGGCEPACLTRLQARPMLPACGPRCGQKRAALPDGGRHWY